MSVSIVESVMGVLGFDSENRVVDAVYFPEGRAAGAMWLLLDGDIPEEMAELVLKLLDKGFKSLVFEDEDVARRVSERFGVEISVHNPSVAGRFLRRNAAEFGVEVGCVSSKEEYHRLVHRLANDMARKGIKRQSERRDLLVSQAILALDDLEETLNLFSNRVREWYGLYFPELERLVEGNEAYMRLVSRLGDRSRFTLESLEEEGIPPERAESIALRAKDSMGGELEGEDLSEVRSMAGDLLQLFGSRRSLEEYIDGVISETAPNLRRLAGPLLGARLIASVGGLENLAKKPSSKIQVLGAEKALYRSFRTGSRPPKHGLIFQHQDVHRAPARQRGKIARALAGKLAIAARVDFYRKGELRERLLEGFEERLEEIRGSADNSYKRSDSGGGRR